MRKSVKSVALFSAIALVLSLMVPAASFAASDDGLGDTVSNWDKERYGDTVDITSQLNKKSQDEEFQKKAKQQIKEAADEVQNKLNNVGNGSSNSPHFTYDGGTKLFLTQGANNSLVFKEFTLRSVGENVEIWVANDLSFPEGDPRDPQVVTQEQVDKLRDEFDSNIYPSVTNFFGTPDSLDGSNAIAPGMVGLPGDYYKSENGNDKTLMLVDNIVDENYYNPDYPFFVAGFFWQTLELYMDRNIITIDTNNWEERLENTFFGTTIHEFQHLVHADNDSDETSWLNEGFSTFSEYLGGYGHDAGSINFLLDHPENSLTAWDEHVDAETGPETIADYGLVYLFTLYNYEQFGQDFILDVAKSPLNSIDSYNQAYEENGIDETFQSVYEKFVTAVMIDDAANIKGKKGIYGFETIDLRELPVDDEGTPRGTTVNFEKAKLYEKDGVPAWGADYKKLDFDSKIKNITFDGIDFQPVKWQSVQDPLGSSNEVYWGNEGNEVDNNLIFEADLSNVSEATLTFDHYQQIEEQWDFGAVQVSTDNGQTWTSLANENTRTDITDQGYPKIKENLPGFTGLNEDWQKETFDLSEYAGQKVHISFRYMTDWASNQAGWFVDNIAIPEIGLSYDGTSVEPFMSKAELLENYVNYSVTFVNKDKHGKYKVRHVDPFNVTEEDALQLRQLFKKGTNYMTTWYSAPSDKVNPVPFEYEIELKSNNGKGNNGKGNNGNNGNGNNGRGNGNR
ncbi:choice-of-anchor J domain-containing protein [Virgibacillus doumboii]|uniref:choice-of-anchor J domain-containing protein n=1 Tax=Virgibacillus doumboii TaxID=2697503 RepID=UPI0013DEB08C|nr:choice-of-anchor J domain-containing protein [Virgibacillus doumboii]